MTVPNTATTRVRLRIRRQEGHDGIATWDVFEVALAPRLTLAEALDRIGLHPVTVARERVAPVAYTWGCTGPGCASCTLVAAGRPVTACETLVEEVVAPGGTLTLEPLAKLGVVRDLLVDDRRLRGDRVRVGAASSCLPTRRDGEPSARPPSPLAESLSKCTRCGACVEACPETGSEGGFVGPAAIVASRLADERAPGDHEGRRRRHRALSSPGGIHECGQAQRCLEVCPAGLPLDEVLAVAARDALRALLGRQ